MSSPSVPLPRQAAAEFVGTGLLVTVVIGSGIAAQNLSTDDGVRLLANALATAGGLAVLILVLGPISGAHLNPVISLADWWLGRRRAFGLTGSQLASYVPAQVAGAIGGAILANAMYGQPLVSWSQRQRSGAGLLLSEVIATAGLLVLVVALVRRRRPAVIPWAVGAYIGAAYWWASSTSFANPAATIGRAFSNTFAGIAPSSVPGFVLAQAVGLLVAIGAVLTLVGARPAAAASPAAFEDNVMYRFTRERLTALAQSKGAIVSDVPEVLFVCVHNAGRSQMAAALLDHYAQGRVHVRSAGSEPADSINPAVSAALAEIGLDISKEFPKPLTDEVARASDVLVTMGCGDACPVYPGKRYLDWELQDPAGQPIEIVRRVRDDIDTRVRGLLAELVPGIGLPPSLTNAVG
jgi:arsenate reductase